jgi:hypothetical protein
MTARDPDNGQLVDADDHSGDVIKELRTRVTNERIESAKRVAYWLRNADELSAVGAAVANGRHAAFEDILKWLDELEPKSKDVTTHNPSCITDPRSHFDLLVKFIEDVKQDSSQGSGVAHEASFETCKAILGYADDLKQYRP